MSLNTHHFSHYEHANSKDKDINKNILPTPITINIKSFGAIGDGIHDDYASITKALQSVQANSNTILIPKGNYLISKTLQTFHDGTKLTFEKGAKIIIKDNISGGVIILNNHCQVLNGYFQGPGISANSIYQGFGILLEAVIGCAIKNCYFNRISGCNIYLSFNKNKGCDHCNILNNTIIRPAMDRKIIVDASGILVGYSGSDYFHTNNLIANNYIDGDETLAEGIAIIGHGSNNIIFNNHVKNCLRYGIIAYESSDVESTLTRTYITHNTVENIGDKKGKTNPYGMGIYIAQSHYSVVSHNKVYNCLINTDNTESLPPGAISNNGSCYCRIDSNKIKNSHKYGIACAYGFNTQLIGNNIDITYKSGIYLIVSNNNIVRANTLKNVKEAGIKGIFDNTAKPAYKTIGLLKKFQNCTTGHGIEISHNIIASSSGKAILLTGVGSDKPEEYANNPLENISIYNNTIIGKFNHSAIQLNNAVKNKIENNLFKKN